MDTQLNILRAQQMATDLARTAREASRRADARPPEAGGRRRAGVIGRVAVLVPHSGAAGVAQLADAGSDAIAAGDPVAGAVTLRIAAPADLRALLRLSALDSAPVPEQPVLLAVVEEDVRAAVSLADGAVIADPFQPTAALIELLQQRARQLSAQARDERSGTAPVRGARLALRAARTQ